MFAVTGLVHHRFHGDYWCTVALGVEQPSLQAQLEHHVAARGLPYSRFATRPGVQLGPLCLDEMAAVADWLEPIRTDEPCRLFDCRHKPLPAWQRHDIASTPHSIDHGPLFRVELPIVDLLTPTLPFEES